MATGTRAHRQGKRRHCGRSGRSRWRPASDFAPLSARWYCSLIEQASHPRSTLKGNPPMKRFLVTTAALLGVCSVAACGGADKTTTSPGQGPTSTPDNAAPASTSEDAVALAGEVKERYAVEGQYPPDPVTVMSLIDQGKLHLSVAGDRVHSFWALTRQDGFLLCVVNDDTRDWAFYDSTTGGIIDGTAGPGDATAFDGPCAQSS